MNSEERFKKDLEDLVHSKEFPFDEQNWEKARDMIDATKNGKRRSAPFLVAALLLIVASLTGFYLLFDSGSASSEKLAVTPVKEKPATVLPSETNVSAENSTPGTKVNAVSPSSAPSKQALKAPEAPLKNNTPASEKKPIPVKDPVTSVAPSEPEEQSPVNETVSVSTGNVSIEMHAVTSTPSKQNSETENPGEIAKQQNTDPANDNASLALPPLAEKETPVASEVKEPAAEPAEKTKTPDLLNPVSALPKDSSLASAPITIPDSAKSNPVPLPGDNDKGELGRPKDFTVLFSVEAGTSYLYGWQNPGTRDANGFTPVLGINYFNTISSKMSVSFGLQYSSVNNLNYSKYTTKVTRLNLGEESRVSVFTPGKLHYAIMPLRFNYSLSPMNTIGIAANIAYLLNAEGKVETYTQKLNTIEDRSVSRTTGYVEGLKKYDTQVSVFYKRGLHPNLALNLEVFYGLTDIKDNTFFNSNVFERNSGLKLTLVYNFLKK